MTGEPMGEVACSYWLPRRGHVPRRMALDAAASVFMSVLPIRPVTRETEAERSRGALGGDGIWPRRPGLRRGKARREEQGRSGSAAESFELRQPWPQLEVLWQRRGAALPCLASAATMTGLL